LLERSRNTQKDVELSKRSKSISKDLETSGKIQTHLERFERLLKDLDIGRKI
jgi:hypothetical protein